MISIAETYKIIISSLLSYDMHTYIYTTNHFGVESEVK